jgi:DNA topoisomerase IA
MLGVVDMTRGSSRRGVMTRAARRTVSGYGRIKTAVTWVVVSPTRTVKSYRVHPYGTVRVVIRYLPAVPAVLFAQRRTIHHRTLLVDTTYKVL